MKALPLGAARVRAGKISLTSSLATLVADQALSEVLTGKPATFSWQELLGGGTGFPPQRLASYGGTADAGFFRSAARTTKATRDSSRGVRS